MTLHNILKKLSDDFFNFHSDSRIKAMIKNGVIDKDSVASKWLGYLSVSEQDIRRKEKELNTVLPPSYREFLMTSNGFRFVSPFLDNLFPIEKINWAKNTEEEWFLEMIDYEKFKVTDKEYFYYKKDQNTAWYRHEYLKVSLKVSEWCDGMCIFLNPVVKHEEEWEVLEYATWFPGVRRYRSFKEYLSAVHQRNITLIKKNNNLS